MVLDNFLLRKSSEKDSRRSGADPSRKPGGRDRPDVPGAPGWGTRARCQTEAPFLVLAPKTPGVSLRWLLAGTPEVCLRPVVLPLHLLALQWTWTKIYGWPLWNT